MGKPVALPFGAVDRVPATSAARRLVVLDALRGACALVVLLHHVLTLFPATCGGITPALRGGAMSVARLAHGSELAAALAAFASRRSTEAVLLFFVLSGFSIRLSVERRGLRDAASIGDYLRRRARRILPPYLLALALSALVAHTVAPVPAAAVSLSTLAGNLLFLQTAIGVPGQWFMPYAGNAPLWSLSFEVFYYLSYPLLAVGVPDARRRSLIVLALSALGFAAGAVAANPFAMFCAAFPIWYFGVELAELHLRGRASLPLRAFAVLCLLLAAARVSPRGHEFHGVWVGCCMFLVGAVLLQRRERLGALHERARAPLLEPLAVVGVVSYPLYLLHVPILRACHALLGDSASSLAAGVCVSLAIAWCVEHGLRRPRASDTHVQVSTVAGS